MRPYLRSGLVQLAIALLLASTAALYALSLLDALLGTALAASLLWLAKSDLDSFELPDLGNLAVAALGATWIATLADPAAGLLQAAFRAIAAAGCLWAVKWSYAKSRGLEGLGWGDVKLAAAGAIWLHWSQLPIALLIASAGAIVLVAGYGGLSGPKIRAFAPIPFGAFLAPSIWIVWFAGRLGLL